MKPPRMRHAQETMHALKATSCDFSLISASVIAKKHQQEEKDKVI